MKKTNVEWKRNLRKIPDGVVTKVGRLKNNDIVVACVKKVNEEDILAGKYSQLDIRIKNGELLFPDSIVPRPSMGKYSSWNVSGHEVVRRDLPMTIKTYSWESPDYGDWSKGSHEVSMDREVYQRDYIPPRLVDIKIELIGKELNEVTFYVFKFTVNEVLDRSSKHFNDDLFVNLNLLQENVGVVDVFTSDASLADYMKTVYVQWEILPPGEREETINKIFSGFNTSSQEVRRQLVARYDLLSNLNPIAFISGTNGFRRYFGAQFADNLVVFENLEYGNAVYVMFDNWKTLSRMSRVELLSGERKGFIRVVHVSGWEDRLNKIVMQPPVTEQGVRRPLR